MNSACKEQPLSDKCPSSELVDGTSSPAPSRDPRIADFSPVVVVCTQNVHSWEDTYAELAAARLAAGEKIRATSRP